ncbi:MAG: type I-E CRISPR-associated protein Cas5/CasD [Alphaproteobacteria bacterium]|nr:type I-E CRISPR-associated protein Cas5/CasD [Alphaproteobacteria bacterium]
MATFLLFQLYGPLASWGEIAVGERRSSWNRPSKSAVLGLVAAALGIERGDDDAHRALFGRFGFAVRVDRQGTPLRDYHTAQSPPREGKRDWSTRCDELSGARESLSTILSQRYYYADALATAALWAAPGAPHPLEGLRQRLERPEFGLYLGRRSCPLALPLAAEIIEATGLIDALTRYRPALRPDSFGGGFPDDPAPVLYWEGDPAPPGEQPSIGRSLSRRDGIGLRSRRLFAERDENVTVLDG